MYILQHCIKWYYNQIGYKYQLVIESNIGQPFISASLISTCIDLICLSVPTTNAVQISISVADILADLIIGTPLTREHLNFADDYTLIDAYLETVVYVKHAISISRLIPLIL